MDTRILNAERLAAIPGCISSAELFSQAVKTGKKVKYYVLQRQNHRILIRYVTPNGNITNGEGKQYDNFKPGVPRFTNYWFAYAYKCKVDQQREK
jgi:hypothetical protein